MRMDKMSDDLKFLLICSTTLFALLALPVGCTMHQTHTIGEAIKAGADPFEARCALDTQSNQTLCITTHQQKGK